MYSIFLDPIKKKRRIHFRTSFANTEKRGEKPRQKIEDELYKYAV